MMIRLLTFGVLCGATAAVFASAAGAGLVMVFAAYSTAGSLGLVAMALSAQADT